MKKTQESTKTQNKLITTLVRTLVCPQNGISNRPVTARHMITNYKNRCVAKVVKNRSSTKGG